MLLYMNERTRMKTWKLLFIIKHCNRENLSLHHIVMIAKFVDDKLKKLLKSLFAVFQTSLIFNIQFRLIW